MVSRGKRPERVTRVVYHRNRFKPQLSVQHVFTIKRNVIDDLKFVIRIISIETGIEIKLNNNGFPCISNVLYSFLFGVKLGFLKRFLSNEFPPRAVQETNCTIQYGTFPIPVPNSVVSRIHVFLENTFVNVERLRNIINQRLL